MKNFMLAVVLLFHLAPLAELCAFEELPIGGYNITKLGSVKVTTDKECMTACYNNPECSFATHDYADHQCRFYKEGSRLVYIIDPDMYKIFRLDRNLIRPTCPKLASLP